MLNIFHVDWTFNIIYGSCVFISLVHLLIGLFDVWGYSLCIVVHSIY